MSDIKSIIEKSESKGLSLVSYISKHRTVIIVFVVCIAVLASLLQTQKYLNPARNEDKYNEIKSSISVKKIDDKKLENLQQTQQDKTETADGSLVPDRSNPFTE